SPRHALQRLLGATVEYPHGCCEQTAARIAAAVAVREVHVADPAAREAAETALLAGLARQRLMALPGGGFRTYPEGEPAPRWLSREAARHLLALRVVAEDPEAAEPLRQAAREGLQWSGRTFKALGGVRRSA